MPLRFILIDDSKEQVCIENCSEHVSVNIPFQDTITFQPLERRIISIGIRAKICIDMGKSPIGRDIWIEQPDCMFIIPHKNLYTTPLNMIGGPMLLRPGDNIEVCFENTCADTSYTVERGRILIQLCAPDLKPLEVRLR